MDVRQRAGAGGTDNTNAPLIVELGNSLTSKPRKSGTITGRSTLSLKQQQQGTGTTFMQSLIAQPILLTIIVGSLLFLLYYAFVNDATAAQFFHSSNNSSSTTSSFERNLVNAEASIALQDQQQTIQGLKAEITQYKDQIDSLSNDLKKIDEKKNQLIQYKQRMHEAIQTLSKRHLLNKYGPGPHKVSIQIEFDPKSNVYDVNEPGGIITIELAPSDEMPATVYFFLEQVSTGLMDGCSFHRNAHHVVQGGPAINFQRSRGKHKDFKEAQLESVPFQEYSPNFPHVQYTLGYAGRPGGPDFYISTLDNTLNHGPGGQGSYDDPNEADPCFAKVVDGFDVVKRMHKSNVKPGGYNAMEHNIAIVQMKLLLPEEEVVVNA